MVLQWLSQKLLVWLGMTTSYVLKIPKIKSIPQLYDGITIYEGDIGWNFLESMNVLNWSKY
jgi:hypothetical protein